jgi:hypothetical protein
MLANFKGEKVLVYRWEAYTYYFYKYIRGVQMRDIDRIGLFLKKVEELWGKLPDWRFGQLMTNFISEKGDIFYWEEDKFLEELEDYINNITTSK